MRPAHPHKLTIDNDLTAPANDTDPVIDVDNLVTDADEVSAVARLMEADPDQRWQDTSSWMTSLILHLICFLLVTSISVPWAAQGGSGSREGLTLTMGFADTEHDADGRSLSIAIEPSTEQDQAEQQADDPLMTPTKPPPSPQKEAQPSQSRRQRSQARPSKSTSVYGQWLEQRMNEPVELDSSSRYAAVLNRTRRNFHPAPMASQLETEEVASAEILDAEQIRYDKIVDDFIKYDIGQLRGKAGQAARQRFMNLGQDSVPALVRGLNKSAGMHASCPVGVIAGKLIQTLRGVTDSSLSQYAIDNIGRGVPENAPHFRRLSALRRRWLGQVNDVPEAVAAVVAQQTMRDDGQLVELVLALSDAPIDTLIAALESGDDRLCSAALIALTQSRASLPHEQRIRLVGTLTRLSESFETQPEKSLVNEALSAVRSRI